MSAPEEVDVAVVGGGQAGAEFVWSLRSGGFSGSVLLLCGEDSLPYERPPLSKGVLTGEMDPGRLVLRSGTAYEAKGIAVRQGVTVDSVDPGARVLETSDGDRVRFKTLVLATGAAPIRPDWADKSTVTVRNLGDVERVRHDRPKEVVIVGGGFLGLELACSLRATGAEVTVVELADSVLVGRVSPFTAGRMAAMHRARGVRLRTDEHVVSVGTQAGRRMVQLSDGSNLECDLVIAAVGARPNVDLARQAGAECRRAVIVDEACRTSVPGVYAIGDVASHLDASGGEVRVEAVSNALHMARTAAASVNGKPLPRKRPTTFWSEQWGVRLQTVGLPVPGNDVDDQVVESGEGEFTVRRTVDGRLHSFEAMGAPADFLKATRELTDHEGQVQVGA